MYRQSPSRNHRSKGIKVKYVLQVCLLLAVCLWLIYQIKHSHDKKKEFEERDRKASLRRETNDKIIKLGRKDIVRPRDDQTTSKIDEPIEEEDITEEDGENKPEEEETEEKNVEEKGNNTNNSNNVEDEQESSDAEADREEDSVDENENQEVVSQDEHGHMERESVSEENMNTHEAREEHYKADDASSAVTHDTNQTNESGRTENLNEHFENVLEEENKVKDIEENNSGVYRKDLEVGNGEIGIVDRKSNVTTGEMKVDVMSGSGNGSPPNNTVMEGSRRDLTSNGSSEVKSANHDSSETKPELDHDSQDIASEQTDNSIRNDDTNWFGSNSIGSLETKDAESPSEDLYNSSNNNTESVSEKKDEDKTDTFDMTDGTYENNESTGTENPEDDVQHDGIDESDMSNLMEEKHVRTDLDTLPEMQTEGTNRYDDVAAE